MTGSVKIVGCSFNSTTLNGQPMNAGECPIEGRFGNVSWPNGWSEKLKAEWRRQRFCQGAEWSLYPLFLERASFAAANP